MQTIGQLLEHVTLLTEIFPAGGEKIFMGKKFLWNLRYLEQWYTMCKVSTWFRVNILTCFYNKNKYSRVR